MVLAMAKPFCLILSQFCTEFVFKISYQLAHDGVNLLISERFCLILYQEIDSIAFLPASKFFPSYTSKSLTSFSSFLSVE